MQVRLEPRVPRARRVTLERPDLLARPAQLDLRVIQAQQEQRAQLVRRD